MGNAEKRALEKYPLMSEDDKEGLEALKYVGMECECASAFNEVQEAKQAYFIEGYHQAEKDNELTWEDINTIIGLYNDLDDKTLCSPKRACKEILKQFKERKEK